MLRRTKRHLAAKYLDQMGNDANGFLLPAWYVAEQPSALDLNIASIIWGFSLACACFTFTKATQQSWASYKRGKLRNAYIIMVWAEWFVCLIISIISWLYLSPSLIILPGFWIFFWLCKCPVKLTLPEVCQLTRASSGSVGCSDPMHIPDHHQQGSPVDGRSTKGQPPQMGHRYFCRLDTDQCVHHMDTSPTTNLATMGRHQHLVGSCRKDVVCLVRQWSQFLFYLPRPVEVDLQRIDEVQ